MRKKLCYLSVLIFGISFLINDTLLAAPAEWELAKSSDGITIYTREVADSASKEFKGVVRITTSMNSLLNLMNDTGAYSQWLHSCILAKVLRQNSKISRTSYSVIKAPWPVSNRDIVTTSKIEHDKKTGVVTIHLWAEPDLYPEQAGNVRVRKMKGYWKFIPNEKNNVTVIYSVHSEPGGSLPDAVANASIIDIPFNTLRNMRKIVQNQKYQSAVQNEGQ